MSSHQKSSRPRCERCQRPVSHCLCAHVSVVDNRTPVMILQHPDEARHPLNTARLAVLGLCRAELVVGEHFPQLDKRLATSGGAMLLFPEPVGNLAQGVGEGLLTNASLGHESGLTHASDRKALAPSPIQLLVVPDGTWRKARKIVNANPALQALPRLGLPAGEPSQYKVRKAAEPGALSTIEAIARALAILEPDQDFQPMLSPFHALVQQQIKAMGPEVYRRNHAKGDAFSRCQ